MDHNIPTLVLPGDEPEKQETPAQEASVQETPAVQEAPAAQAAVQAAPAPQAEAKEEPVAAEDDSLNFDNLSEQEKAAVLAFVERIDISDSETVLKYGNAAQMKISQFSDKILEDVKTKDTGAISDMLTNLVAELKGFDVDEGKKGGLFGLFKKAGNSVTQLKARFEKVEENVMEIITTLQTHQKQLISDAKMLDELYAQNEQYYHELTLYIIAGELKLRRLREEELPPLLAKAQETADPADAQAANDFAQLIERFEKRIHDLKLTRMVSVQMGPQIRLMQQNDNVLAERIQSTIVNTIPLWKSQMVIALGMQHAETALKAQKAVTDMTNELLRSNAERLKVGTIETAKEAERGVIDIETIRVANTALIDTLTEVQRIQREGAQKRAEASIELGRLEKELRDKVLEINKK
ncbi:MAG: toxic anion resistance protein [Clostridiales bacterium]|nr:toxic anion resistance protein [Clostridiales bacterium]MDY5513642.1 toxic anion resistance protein [Candidatus Ventricola sp.]